MSHSEANRKDFADRLRLAREHMELSREDFGDRIGYSVRQIRHWESCGCIDAFPLRAVSQATGRSLEWFYLPLYEDVPR